MRTVALLLLAVAVPAHAEMSVATFLAKADALEKKGMLAMMSPDVGLLKQEMGKVTTSYRDDIRAARSEGRRPHSCPPPKASMNSGDLMAHFRTIPGSTGLKAGFYSMRKKRYPCPA